MLKGLDAKANSVSSSPAGKRITPGSAECTNDTLVPSSPPYFSRIVDVYPLVLKYHSSVGCIDNGRVDSVCFSPDGRWFVSGSADKTSQVWDTETDKTRT
ncbi:hypothetical protein M408DRAFT_25913 [Serendipita vermifera MAFF 305830]|uniref:Uncharacterized protein n=1 Tax=Serendipita vermifera MAFF 305830 TaxID=933852 RepID=A0A0C2X995_SERVB|nr:hypothetical protein M408DRAFT_25913 [Serendipita vermifera MAFF 305830]